MPPAANVLSRKLRHGGVARSPLADTDLLGETFARGVEDRMRLLVKTLIGTAVGAARVAKLSDATAKITGPSMLGLVDVEDADTPGLIAIESDLAYHLDRPHARRRPGAGAASRRRGPSPPSTWRSAGCISTPSSPPSPMRSAPTSAGR